MELVLLVPPTEIYQIVIVKLTIMKQSFSEKEFVKFVMLDVKNVKILIIIVTLVPTEP